MTGRRIPGLGLGLALGLLAVNVGAQLNDGLVVEPWVAGSYRSAMVDAGRCDSEVSWVEQRPDGSWYAVCEADSYSGADSGLCGLYAAWAYWACQHGYRASTDDVSCSDAADEALEACGEWRP
jgi:hypothetical protein